MSLGIILKDGIYLKGTKRTTLKVFISDLYFEGEEKLNMGDSVWIFMENTTHVTAVLAGRKFRRPIAVYSHYMARSKLTA